MWRSSPSLFVLFAIFFGSFLVIECDKNIQILAPPSRKNLSNSQRKETKWVAELFSEGQKKFDMNSGVNEKCRHDFQLYKSHLQNQSIWALRMMESSEWPGIGIFSGMTKKLGNWFECLLISDYNVTGKYCFVSAEYDIGRRGAALDASSKIDERDSVWNALQQLKNEPWKLNRQNLSWAICIPASCQSEDITASLQQTLRPIFEDEGLNINVNVDPQFCTIKEEKPYASSFYMAGLFFIGIVGFIVTLSLLHYKRSEKLPKEKGEKHFSSDILEAVSIQQNYRNLVRVAPSDAAAVYLLKIVYMVIVTIGHRLLYTFAYPKHNPEYLEKSLFSEESSRMEVGVYFTGYAVVEVFFTVSGFILFYYGFAKTKKEGWSHIIQIITVRWARMIPTVISVMVIVGYIFPYLNEGPLWERRVNAAAENCHSTFWYNVFAVGNIFGTDRLCLFNLWYVSTDLQLTLIGSILLLICTKNEIAGLVSLVVTFIIGIVASFVIAYKHKFHGMLHIYMSNSDQGIFNPEFKDFYMLSYTRVASYTLGCAAGYITRKLKERKFKFSTSQLTCMLLLWIPLKALFMWYVPTQLEFYTKYDRLNAAFNAAVLRTIFILPDVMNVCGYYTNSRAIIYKLFNMDVWVPIGRLLYCMYLISVVIQFFQVASFQTLMPTFAYLPIIWFGVADVIFSFAAAFILHLFIEAPLGNMSKVIISRYIK